MEKVIYKSGDLSNFFNNKRKEIIHDADIDLLFANKEKKKEVLNTNIIEEIKIKKPSKSNSTNIVNQDYKSPQRNSVSLTKREINIKNASKRLKRKLFTGDMKVKNERTIFVGNISNETKKKDLLKLFETCGNIQSIRIRSVPVASFKLPKKALVIRKDFNPSRHNMNAYVVFEKEESCDLAIKMNGIEFQGLHLRLDKVKNSKKHDTKYTIFVGNLPFDIEEEDLRNFFNDCGEIDNIRVVRDRVTSVGKGIAYISFKENESVDLALTMEGSECKNRKIRIMKAVKSLKKFKKKKDENTKDDKSKSRYSNKITRKENSISKTKFNKSDKNLVTKLKKKERIYSDLLSEEKLKNKKFIKKKQHLKQKFISLNMANYFKDKFVN